MSLSLFFLLLSVPVIPVGLFLYHRDYHRYGRTRTVGATAVWIVFFMPHLVLGFSADFPPALEGAWGPVGLALMVVAVALCMVAMRRFRSTRMVVGAEQPYLVSDGFYRWSRNPQYVLWGLFVVGYALIVRNTMAWVAVALYAAMVHATVLVEERHLERLFGEEYADFRQRTSRYLGFSRSSG